MISNTKNHPEVDRTAIAATGIIWLEDMRSSNKWNLTLDEVSLLLGAQSRNTYKAWLKKSAATGKVDLGIDTYTRLSLLAGIHGALAMSAPQGAEFDFFNRAINHPLFEMMSAKELLLKNPTIPFLMAVRKHFDARRA